MFFDPWSSYVQAIPRKTGDGAFVYEMHILIELPEPFSFAQREVQTIREEAFDDFVAEIARRAAHALAAADAAGKKF